MSPQNALLGFWSKNRLILALMWVVEVNFIYYTSCVYTNICISIVCISIYLSVSLSMNLFGTMIFIRLSTLEFSHCRWDLKWACKYLSIYSYIHISVYLSVYQSIHLSIHVSTLSKSSHEFLKKGSSKKKSRIVIGTLLPAADIFRRCVGWDSGRKSHWVQLAKKTNSPIGTWKCNFPPV